SVPSRFLQRIQYDGSLRLFSRVLSNFLEGVGGALESCVPGRASQLRDDVAVWKDKVSFHGVFELPYIAWPIVPDTCFQQILRQSLYRTAVSFSILLEKEVA